MSNTPSEQAIRELIAEWADAVCRGDMQRVIADRSDDIVMYDVPKPLQQKGLDAYRQTWRLFFEHNEAGPDRFRLSDVHIVAGEEVAYAFGLLTIGGGDAHCRVTLGLRRLEGTWTVTHEHHSIPINAD